MTTTCGTCGASYDPQISSHRTGLDCIPNLAAKINALVTKQSQNYFGLAKELDSQSELIQKLKNELQAAFRRITVLEHPTMARTIAPVIARDKAAGLGTDKTE